jgi:hypothetical protein
MWAGSGTAGWGLAIMTFEVRAQHTTTIVVSATGSYRRFTSPARAGDAHLVGADGRTLCGLDARDWKRVTSRRWLNLGSHRCPGCHDALVALSTTARPGDARSNGGRT